MRECKHSKAFFQKIKKKSHAFSHQSNDILSDIKYFRRSIKTPSKSLSYVSSISFLNCMHFIAVFIKNIIGDMKKKSQNKSLIYGLKFIKLNKHSYENAEP